MRHTMIYKSMDGAICLGHYFREEFILAVLMLQADFSVFYLGSVFLQFFFPFAEDNIW